MRIQRIFTCFTYGLGLGNVRVRVIVRLTLTLKPNPNPIRRISRIPRIRIFWFFELIFYYLI